MCYIEIKILEFVNKFYFPNFAKVSATKIWCAINTVDIVTLRETVYDGKGVRPSKLNTDTKNII